MSGSSRFDLSGRNFTLIHCSESFVESCQTLRVTLPSGLIILLTVLPFPKVQQSSRQQEVRVNVINETENDLLLVVNFGRSKRPNTNCTFHFGRGTLHPNIRYVHMEILKPAIGSSGSGSKRPGSGIVLYAL